MIDANPEIVAGVKEIDRRAAWGNVDAVTNLHYQLVQILRPEELLLVAQESGTPKSKLKLKDAAAFLDYEVAAYSDQQRGIDRETHTQNHPLPKNYDEYQRAYNSVWNAIVDESRK